MEISTTPSFRVPDGLKDGVLIAFVAIVGVVAVADLERLPELLSFVLSSGTATLPLLLLAAVMAAILKASGADNLIAKAFSGHPLRAVVTATLIGALSPFCSCGVIPIITSMLSIGVPLGPVMAFWLSSPLMDPSMFIITTSTLGLEFAIAKTIAAIGMGLTGGLLAHALSASGWVGTTLKSGVVSDGCASSKVLNPKNVVWAFWREPARQAGFWSAVRTTTLFLGKWLLLAFLLEALMLVYVPVGPTLANIDGDGLLPIAVATLIGIPAYLNGYAALPLVSGLLTQGLPPGAAMAFLLGGGVTSIPAVTAVVAIARPRVVAIYLITALLGAFLFAVLYAALQA